ncbi:hybrid sensor histidine kinase/response regulator [Nostoc sp. 'Peltigera membranacea cyanobiont' 213]|uniref:sensor histidine kinase n=1 Tax=Nostoc cyanobionts TaxID=3123326 RepID=UPI000B9580DA|nr:MULTISPECIES: response regulator [unclassified Nostoc]AVH64078.1 response regulator receiver sensor signal transduction histidine kinase [Nostoc sp. 'Peltigera membranacea cyanobiont' N6]OYD87410.1 hybrid sensor histidine kinase/response regulator [Nostoc sp. 'Peltigera membranacea cyanobiont' 213]
MKILSKTEILVVDDLPDNLRLVSNLLVEQGYVVRKATNGTMALRSAQAEPPDLILLDINMPDLDGYEVCRQLKTFDNTRAIPVIFLSALDDAIDKVKAFKVGGIDYITKPFQVEEMLIRIQTQLTVQRFTQTLEQQVEQRTTELSQALHHLKETQLQLVQHEKMSALGNLVAGIAHEINNPVGFIAGNLQPAIDYINDLFRLVDFYQTKMPDVEPDIADIDLEYMREDLPKLINSLKLGVQRIRHISTSLRTFSRADQDYKVLFNIHEGIDSTIMILKHRLKASDDRPEIEIVKDYANLPQVECFPGQLNQVFMNILANAIDALEDSNIGRSFTDIEVNPNQITVKTELSNDSQFVNICIQDNGIGMRNDVKQKIFEHLYTTKAVGKGTGLGLAIAHQIVVEKHRGALAVNSTLGEGTEFVITLPVKGG